MAILLEWVITGVAAFVATNVDDILLLTLFFSQQNGSFRPKHIVTGQYIGIGLLILVSLLVAYGLLLLPGQWIGLLGLVPIGMGIWRLVRVLPLVTKPGEVLHIAPTGSVLGGFLSPFTYSVAAVTVANGADNIAVYVPVFAGGGAARVAVIVVVFLVLVGVWCYLGARLAQQPTVARTLDRYGQRIVPFVLIAIGLLVLWESGALALFGF